MSWNPFAPSVLADPANGYGELLGRCPVHHFSDFDPPFYTLSRFADVEAALRDIETFSSEFGQGPRFTQPVGMLCDPPQHTFYRGLVQRAFTPRMIESLRPRVRALATALIDTVCARGAASVDFDLHDAFAFPLPVVIIAELLGVPTTDMERFKHWSDVQVAAMGAKDPRPYAEDQAAFFAYLVQRLQQAREIAQRTPQRQQPTPVGTAGVTALAEAAEQPENLLVYLAGARDNGELLPEAQLLSVLSQLLVGGNETTTSLITNAMWRLLQFGLWPEVVAHPELIDAAVEESLRFDPPVLSLYRNTTREVRLHDVTIPQGAKVCLHYAAANRDPDVFTAPDRFDLHRPRQRHLAFGLGVHFCLGAPMARLEAHVALATLAQRLPQLSLLNDGERIAPFFLWGRRRLPVRGVINHPL